MAEIYLYTGSTIPTPPGNGRFVGIKQIAADGTVTDVGPQRTESATITAPASVATGARFVLERWNTASGVGRRTEQRLHVIGVGGQTPSEQRLAQVVSAISDAGADGKKRVRIDEHEAELFDLDQLRRMERALRSLAKSERAALDGDGVSTGGAPLRVVGVRI